MSHSELDSESFTRSIQNATPTTLLLALLTLPNFKAYLSAIQSFRTCFGIFYTIQLSEASAAFLLTHSYVT